MIPAGLTTGPDYETEWGIFYHGLLIGIRDDAPEEIKKRYEIDSEICAKAAEVMYSDLNE